MPEAVAKEAAASEAAEETSDKTAHWAAAPAATTNWSNNKIAFIWVELFRQVVVWSQVVPTPKCQV